MTYSNHRNRLKHRPWGTEILLFPHQHEDLLIAKVSIITNTKRIAPCSKTAENRNSPDSTLRKTWHFNDTFTSWPGCGQIISGFGENYARLHRNKQGAPGGTLSPGFFIPSSHSPEIVVLHLQEQKSNYFCMPLSALLFVCSHSLGHTWLEIWPVSNDTLSTFCVGDYGSWVGVVRGAGIGER